MLTTTTPVFDRMMDTREALVLKPRLEQYLIEARFPEWFTVEFHKAGVQRRPDGHFHASTHPGWTERQLYYYLTEPTHVDMPPLGHASRLAVTMGTATHSFLQFCLREMGATVPLPTGDCVACGLPHGYGRGRCDEPGVNNSQIGVEGHMDGVLNLPESGALWRPGLGGLEIKSAGDQRLMSLQDNDLVTFKLRFPAYYNQVQTYMEATGLSQFLVLFIVFSPWRLVEVQVPYDAAHALGIRRTFENVLASVASGTVPEACCSPGSKTAKTCPVRSICPIGRISQ